MISNFLGDVGMPSGGSIISSQELISREGVELHKGMNFRDAGDQLSVFLVIPRETGFRDSWNAVTGVYEYEGHDSTTVESGKSVDQLGMYPSGKLTENGRFFKEARAYEDGTRKGALQIQVYEKLDAGVWYDKGIFNLVDARLVEEGGRKVFKMYLTLADAELYSVDDPDTLERMLPAAVKAEAWKHGRGRCAECDIQSGLHFVHVRGVSVQLRCARHGGMVGGGLLG